MNAKLLLRRLVIATMWVALAAAAAAATPAQDRQFTDAFRKAFTSGDAGALAALLYTRDADQRAIDFYTAMLATGAGAKIVSLDLKDLTADDRARLARAPAPDGRPMRFPVEPTRKLVVRTEQRDRNGNANGTTTLFVALVDGQWRIPVPGPR